MKTRFILLKVTLNLLAAALGLFLIYAGIIDYHFIRGLLGVLLFVSSCGLTILDVTIKKDNY